MSNEKKNAWFIGGGNEKEVGGNKVILASINLKKLKEFLTEASAGEREAAVIPSKKDDETKYLKLIIEERESKYDTHSIKVNTWRPQNQESNKQKNKSGGDDLPF